jgi:hypothetical protein
VQVPLHPLRERVVARTAPQAQQRQPPANSEGGSP